MPSKKTLSRFDHKQPITCQFILINHKPFWVNFLQETKQGLSEFTSNPTHFVKEIFDEVKDAHSSPYWSKGVKGSTLLWTASFLSIMIYGGFNWDWYKPNIETDQFSIVGKNETVRYIDLSMPLPPEYIAKQVENLAKQKALDISPENTPANTDSTFIDGDNRLNRTFVDISKPKAPSEGIFSEEIPLTIVNTSQSTFTSDGSINTTRLRINKKQVVLESGEVVKESIFDSKGSLQADNRAFLKILTDKAQVGQTRKVALHLSSYHFLTKYSLTLKFNGRNIAVTNVEFAHDFTRDATPPTYKKYNSDQFAALEIIYQPPIYPVKIPVNIPVAYVSLTILDQSLVKADKKVLTDVDAVLKDNNGNEIPLFWVTSRIDLQAKQPAIIMVVPEQEIVDKYKIVAKTIIN